MDLARRPLRIVVSVLVALTGFTPGVRAQESTLKSDLDLLLNYGYLGAFFDPGIAGYETEDRSVRVLNVPVTLTLRDWHRRGWGLRLRIAGVLGVENVDGIGDIPDASLGAFAMIPGVEVPIPLSPTSLLRPFLDVGLAFSIDDADALAPSPIGISALGLRSEFVFPWRRFELGLEPRAFYSVTWSGEELRDDYGIVALRADAQYPLFSIADRILTGLLYVQPAWFIDALDFSSSTEEGTSSIRQQFEIGLGYAWRGDGPKIWILPVPPISVGYSFGDGLEGLRLRVGGSRLIRLPPDTWEDTGTY